MPCCVASTPDTINMGLVLGDNLEKVWNGEAYQQFRAQLESNEPPTICRYCSIYNGVF